MKKLLSLVLALLMALLPAAMGLAEETAQPEATDAVVDDTNWAEYASATQGYAFYYDADAWVVLDKSTVDNALSAAQDSGDQTMQGLISNARTAIEQNDILLLLSSDAQANVNVMCADAGVEISADVLKAMTDTFVAQISAQMTDLQTEDGTGEIVELPAGNALQLIYGYTLSGVHYGGAMYVVAVGTKLYTFTLTAGYDVVTDYAEDVGEMLGSLTVA